MPSTSWKQGKVFIRFARVGMASLEALTYAKEPPLSTLSILLDLTFYPVKCIIKWDSPSIQSNWRL